MYRYILASSVLRWKLLASLFRGTIGVTTIGYDCFFLSRFGVVCMCATLLAFCTPFCSTGHEHPFSIALNCLRDSVDQQQGTHNHTLLLDGTEASFLEQHPKEKQCQFVLKPRLQAPVQLRRGKSCRSAL